ncbi:MAG TPA: FAD-dependent oxidoreductase [Ktedonobacteraceae bacterium]|jgi:glycine/D-amino acid oxidase-like deaminating enzyme|nr:FAD-dependent oxidoreductase [Ktedonobacteraceae bacterium]
MMTKQHTSIAIIGGGCAGWSLALELAQRSVSCIVIDQNPPAAFASTRNQGWLQSGALYAMLEDPVTLDFCQRGHHLIRSQFADVIRPGIPGYFLFYRREDLEQAVEQCHRYNIAARSVSMQELRKHETILGKSRLAYALQVPDVPLDTSKLLQKVAHMACQKGAQFYPAEDLTTFSPQWDGKKWHIMLDHEHEIVCKGIALTCGAYIPEALAKCSPVQPHFKRTKHPVLVLQGDVANSMFMILHQPHSPQLIPFNGPLGRGVTICLSHVEEEIRDYRDKQLPPLYLEQCAEALADFYEGFKTAAIHNQYRAYAYVCQKLSLDTKMSNDRYSRGPVIQSYSPFDEMWQSVFVFYPGKFTSALIAAADCMRLLEASLGDLAECKRQSPRRTPTMALQQYYHQPQYALTVRGERLIFEPVLSGKTSEV